MLDVNRTLALAATILVVACILLVGGCSFESSDVGRLAEDAARDVQREGSDLLSGENTSAQGATQTVKVERIVDGDTIEVSPDAAGGDSVRFLAVDTPETYNGTEPLGPEAKAFTTRQLEGERVRLEYDQDRTDPYGRALAHVSVIDEERTIQQKLLSNGLAQTAWYEPNNRYRTQLESIQENARKSQAGIWELPPGKQCELASHNNGIGEGSEQCRAR